MALRTDCSHVMTQTCARGTGHHCRPCTAVPLSHHPVGPGACWLHNKLPKTEQLETMDFHLLAAFVGTKSGSDSAGTVSGPHAAVKLRAGARGPSESPAWAGSTPRHPGH